MKKTGSTGLSSITPDLPAGLQIDPKTGTISGTPTAVSAETEYTITLAADDNYPSAETKITITVDKGTSTLKALITTLETTKGTKITDITMEKTGSTGTFSISPDLHADTGLDFDKATGEISGTSSILQSETKYTITLAADDNYEAATATVTITVTDKPTSSLSPSSRTLIATIGTAITDITMTKTGSTGTFSIDPDLHANTGLDFDKANGTISGTPTAASAETEYTITLAADDTYPSAEAKINITVNKKASTLSASKETLIATINTAITDITMTKTGSTGTLSITPDLPAGLQIDPKTGTISGTPTAVSAETEYTITLAADDTHLSAEAKINITVNKKASTLSASKETLIATINTAITNITMTKTGSTGTLSITPDLPAGLQFNTATGTISGTPTAASAETEYTITLAADDTYLSAVVKIKITVKDISTLKASTSTLDATIGTFITDITMTKTGSSGTFSIDPDLKTDTGLNFNSLTGAIHGTPSKALSTAKSYTITLAADDNYTSAETSVRITVDKITSSFTLSSSTLNAVVNKTIPDITVKGSVSSGTFSIEPDLHAKTGLDFDDKTGTISGKPTTAAASAVYTITQAADAAYKEATADITIDVISKSISIDASQLSLIGHKNTALTNSITFTKYPSSASGTFTISPDLPDGLKMNQTTGEISGTPTEGKNPAEYKVTFTQASDSATDTVKLEILIYKYKPINLNVLKENVNTEIAAQGNSADLRFIDTSLITRLVAVFQNKTEFNGNISNWEVSQVTNMSGLFDHAHKFNGDISDWDTSNVTNMASMFINAHSFNQNIGKWNTANVENMSNMFEGAKAFNQDISRWDVSSSKMFSYMFKSALVFNQNLYNWNTESATNMDSMFQTASDFNGELSNWKTGRVTNMNFMFHNAGKFNQNIGIWNTENVTSMISMFNYASLFNKDISGWNVKKVTAYNNFRADSALSDANTPAKFR